MDFRDRNLLLSWLCVISTIRIYKKNMRENRITVSYDFFLKKEILSYITSEVMVFPLWKNP